MLELFVQLFLHLLSAVACRGETYTVKNRINNKTQEGNVGTFCPATFYIHLSAFVCRGETNTVKYRIYEKTQG
jgi:hypothetical protein